MRKWTTNRGWCCATGFVGHRRRGADPQVPERAQRPFTVKYKLAIAMSMTARSAEGVRSRQENLPFVVADEPAPSA